MSHKSYKSHLACLCVLTLLDFMPLYTAAAAPDNKPHKKIPVIFDTDIGADIDDTWALCLLLKSPEFDIKLILSDYPKHPAYQKTRFRAKVIAKMLEAAGRTGIPVGLGAGKKYAAGSGRNPGWRITASKSTPARCTRMASPQ